MPRRPYTRTQLLRPVLPHNPPPLRTCKSQGTHRNHEQSTAALGSVRALTRSPLAGMRVGEAPPSPAADRRRKHSFLGIKSAYADMLGMTPTEALPAGARTARTLLALSLLPIRPTPRKLCLSRIALLFSATFGMASEMGQHYTRREVGHDFPYSEGTYLSTRLPLLPLLWIYVLSTVFLVKGCILHRLLIESPSPSELCRAARRSLAASACPYAFYFFWSVYVDIREASRVDEGAADRDLRLAAFYKSLAFTFADALVGVRMVFHNVGLSALCMSEVSRVLVDTVARFETEFVRARHSLHFAFALM
jgi:hypothetical protein